MLKKRKSKRKWGQTRVIRWVVLFRIPRKTKTSHQARLMEERCLTSLPYGNRPRRALNVWTGWLCGVIYVLLTQIFRNILNRMSHSTRAGWEKVHLRWINLHGSAVTSDDPGLEPGSAAPRTVRRKTRLLLTVSDWSYIRVGCTPRSIHNTSCVIGCARTRSPLTINQLISSAAVPRQLFHWSGLIIEEVLR